MSSLAHPDHLSFMFHWGGVGWAGLGWDNIVHVPVHTHRHSNLIIFLAVLQTQALLFHDQLPLEWGRVGWDNNVHVPVRTQAQQPHHLLCCPADTGAALSWSVTGGVGWGGVGQKRSCSCSHTGTATSSSSLLSCRHRHCSFMISYRWGGVGWGGTITFMFLYTHRHSNLIIFLAVLQTQGTLFHDQLPVGWGGTITFMFQYTQAQQPHHLSCCPADNRHCSFMISYLWGGVGWGGTISFMFLYTHRHSKLIIFFAVLQTQALLFHDQLPVGWGGVGWGGTITFMFLYTQAQQPHHLFCCPADTGTALSWSVTGGVGWDNNVHVPVHTQAQQPHHLSCGTALSWSVTGGVGWGGVGPCSWCTHRQSNLIIFFAAVLTQALHFYRPVAVGWGEVVRTLS